MSQNMPFFFGGDAGFPPPPPSQQQPRDPRQEPNQAAQLAPAMVAAQQAAFQQNAQLPALDNPLLANISPAQLAEIARLFQMGALQMPPPPAQAVSAPPSNDAAATPSGPLLTRQAPRAAPNADQSSDTDKEEGEVDEGEMDNTPAERAFLRPPPTGPRNRSNSPRGPPPRADIPKAPAKMLASETPFKRTSPQQRPLQAPRKNGTVNGGQLASKEASAKSFLRELIRAGKNFDDIAREVTDPAALARLFKELNLPIETKQHAQEPTRVTSGATAHPTRTESADKPLVDEKRKISVTKRPPPKDRSEYVALMQAAKNKKTEPPASAAGVPPQTAIASSIAPDSSRIAESDSPSMAAVGGPAPRPTPKTIQNDLIRQRLDALKAAQAAKTNGTAVAASQAVGSSLTPQPNKLLNTSSSPIPGAAAKTLGSGIADNGSRFAEFRSQLPSAPPQPAPPSQYIPQAPSSAFLPPPPTSPSASGGLPGLFLGSFQHPHDHRSGFQPVPGQIPSSTAPLTVPRKRPVAADFDDLLDYTPSNKKSFGMSRDASDEDEPLIIEVSDDEDDEDDMDIEESADIVEGASVQTKSFRDVGPLRDFPSKPNFQQASSTSVTPGNTTPGGRSYEQTMKDIEDMRRRIAEREAKKKANGKPSDALSGAPTTAVEAPTTTPATDSPADPSFATPDRQSTPKVGGKPVAAAPIDVPQTIGSPGVASNTHTRTSSSDRPASAAALVRAQEKERLRQRLLELERDELKSVDATAVATPMVSSPAGQGADQVALETTTQHADVAAYAETAVHEGQAQAASPGGLERSSSEDGELSDGSMDRFYAEDEEHNKAAPTTSSTESSAAPAHVTTNPTQQTEIDLGDSLMGESESPDVDMEIDDDDSPVVEGEVNDLARSNALADDERSLLSSDDESTPTHQPNQARDMNYEPFALSSSGFSPQRVRVQAKEMDEAAESDDASAPATVGQSSTTTIPNPVLGNTHHDDNGGSSTDSDDSDDYEPDAALPMDVGTPADTGKAAAEAAPEDAGAAQPPEETHPGNNDDLPTDLDSASLSVPAKHYYTPYESPLQGFKDYRWHSQYLANVPGGYRSMTFNHKIDADVQLCPYEAAGGKCNDPNCAFQHWKDMGLADKDLLRVMGTINVPARNAEELKKWNEGLSALINQMRAKGVVEMGTIAERIAEYRRKFLQEKGDGGRVVFWREP